MPPRTPRPGALVAGDDIALMTFTWDAWQADLKDGDSFSIALPEELRFRVPQTRDFTHAPDGAQEVVGSCTISATEMTCTFNEVLPLRIKQGYKNVYGAGKVQTVAVKSTSAEALDVVANGSTAVSVDLPGEGGIGQPQFRYVPDAPVKGLPGCPRSPPP